jgi:hypothetical protein
VLRPIPFDYANHDIAKVLKDSTNQEIRNKQDIDKLFSLYFQWPHKSTALLSTFKSTNIPISLEYDENEANISELLIKIDNENVVEGLTDEIIIRIMVFTKCFLFRAKSEDLFLEGEKTYLVITPPQEVLNVNIRKHPRLKITDTVLSLKRTNDAVEFKASLTEISAHSLKVSGEFEGNVSYTTELSGLIVEFNVLKCIKGMTILIPAQEQEENYFELYASLIFPDLVNRENVEYDELYNLYAKTGYFGNFSESLPSNHREILLKTWAAVDNSKTKKNSIDKIISHKGRLIGSSSLTLALKENQMDYWYIHQLCSDKELGNFTDTGNLYIWRFIYLSMKKDDLRVMASFNSRSRWIEKIFLKFAKNREIEDRLECVRYYKAKLKQRAFSPPMNSFSIGSEKRFIDCNEQRLIGIGPDFLNANGNLNFIKYLKDPTENQISEDLEVVSKATKDNEFVRLCLPQNYETDFLEGYEQRSNRFFSLRKDELEDFVTSIEHTIESCKRKYE